ncbi:MAG: DUF1501 domain-containing protein [Gemmataceae bacterium]
MSLFSGGLLNVLAARAAAPPAKVAPRAKACIILFQVGGPYQGDTFDPKPDAPEEVRGIFRTIATRVPGIRMTDALPRIAQHADKLAILRGVHHTIRCHNPAIYCSLVGREATDPMAVSNRTNAQRTDHPHYASVVARFRPGARAMPAHVIIPNVTFNGPARSPGLMGGYLGAAYDPFVLGADPSASDYRIDAFAPQEGVGPLRLDDRRGLLRELDATERLLERSAATRSMGTLYESAFSLLSSPRAREAFDLEREPVAIRNRYGRHMQGQSTLLARRLVEAGVPFVTVFSHTVVERNSWDTHNAHYTLVPNELAPTADQAFAALLEDLSERGLLDDVLVVWLGEFGRTPRMGVNFSNNTNNVGGRDHWCNCYSVVLAGGGVRGGEVIGASDGIGAYPRERPVHISDLAATIFTGLGVDPRAELYDITGQLRFVCAGSPVDEVWR